MLIGRNSSDTLGHLIVSNFLSLIVDGQKKFQKFQIPEGTSVNGNIFKLPGIMTSVVEKATMTRGRTRRHAT